MNFPSDLKYYEEHTWVRVDQDIAIVGISDFAQDELGQILFADLPEPGEEITQGEVFGNVESAKVSADLYAPISGEIIEINEELDDSPELLNESCYEDGWILKVKIKDKSELTTLLDSKAYQDTVK